MIHLVYNSFDHFYSIFLFASYCKSYLNITKRDSKLRKVNRRKTLFPDYYHYVFVIKRFRQRGTFYRTNVIKRLIQIPFEKGRSVQVFHLNFFLKIAKVPGKFYIHWGGMG